MTVEKIALSHPKGEWWYGHLSKALAEMTTIKPVFRIEDDPDGYPLETDITPLLSDWNAQSSFYLGSVAVMFRGINRLQIPTVIWTDYLPTNRAYLPLIRLFDQVFCTQKDSRELLQQGGCPRVHWLPFAFDDTLKNDPSLEKVYDVAFVGNLDSPATREERLGILTEIEAKHRMNDYRTGCFGDGMMETYNKAKIVVNIPVPGGFNMRTFEAMASGALLLTQHVGNGQRDLFADGTHFVCYKDKADLLDKVDYFLKNDKERLEIAGTGMREVLAKHTYRQRAREVLDIMQSRADERGRDASPAAEWEALAFAYRHEKRLKSLLKLSLAKEMPVSQRVRVFKKALTCLGSLCRNAFK